MRQTGEATRECGAIFGLWAEACRSARNCNSPTAGRGREVGFLWSRLMYRQSENYRNLALTIYHGPVSKEEESENELEDLGPISYSLPPLAGSAPMVQQPSCMEDEHPLNYQEQMQRTGMIGVPPPSNDDSYWMM